MTITNDVNAALEKFKSVISVLQDEYLLLTPLLLPYALLVLVPKMVVHIFDLVTSLTGTATIFFPSDTFSEVFNLFEDALLTIEEIGSSRLRVKEISEEVVDEEEVVGSIGFPYKSF